MKITVSGKASPSNPYPWHHLFFSWRALVVFKQRRAAQMKFPLFHLGREAERAWSQPVLARGMMRLTGCWEVREFSGSFHMLRLWKNSANSLHLWAGACCTISVSQGPAKISHHFVHRGYQQPDVTQAERAVSGTFRRTQQNTGLRPGGRVRFSQGWWLLVGVREAEVVRGQHLSWERWKLL